MKELAKELFPMEEGNFQMNMIQSEKRNAFIQGYEYKNVIVENEIKREQQRIFDNLLKILPTNDYGDAIQGDEVYHIIFNKTPDKTLGDIFKKSFEASVEIVMRYLSENHHHHSHTMIQIESNSAQLFEGVKSH